MLARWFVPFVGCAVALAQTVPDHKAVEPPSATEKKAAPAQPRRFTTFPVPDAPPLDVDKATKAAIAALLALQEGEGGDQWPYQGVYREDADPSPVGYRVGGTAIACLALVATPGYAQDEARRQAVARGVAFLVATLDAPRMDGGFVGRYDVRGWGHVYALQLFLHLLDTGTVPAASATKVAEKTPWLVDVLCKSAIPQAGGWNYSRPRGYLDPQNAASTFMTAPALQALFHAKARGYPVPDEVVTQALDALERSRAKPGGYSYSAPATSMAEVDENDLTMMDKTPSSAARAAVCEVTLALAGRGDAGRLARAIDLFFAHWDALAVRKSQGGTHIPPYGIAPYYFLFGHVYAAQAIEQIEDEDRRTRLRARLRDVLAMSREEDGSWNDRQAGRSGGYGTALALLTLHMQHVPKLQRWQPGEPGKTDAK